jgi:hypothetical protein
MQKLFGAGIFVLIFMTGCDSENSKNNVRQPEAVVAQTVQNDTLITVYDGVSPCKGCKAINTNIKFVRSLKDTVGRFHLDETYINKKDSAFQHYEGVGDYKIMPASKGDAKGIAFYNMVLDDHSRGYLYLLQDSVTLVQVDEKGRPTTGDNAVILKRSK